MRVLLYAPVRLFGESLGACLDGDDSVEAVGVTHEVSAITENALRMRAQVILFDVSPGGPPAAAKELAVTCPEIPVVALAVPHVAADVIACADAGFFSYVPRDTPLEGLIAILRMALRGEAACHPAIARCLLRELHRRSQPTDQHHQQHLDDRLTRREVETFRLLSLGLSNKEIAGELNLSIATVKNHVHAILRKLKVSRRGEARELLLERPWIVESA